MEYWPLPGLGLWLVRCGFGGVYHFVRMGCVAGWMVIKVSREVSCVVGCDVWLFCVFRSGCCVVVLVLG